MTVVLKNIRLLFCVCLLASLIVPSSAFATIAKVLAEADLDYAQGRNAQAEEKYSAILEKDPDNYRVIRALAEVKINLGKYEDAESLLSRVLKMEVSMGRNVLVYLEDDSEPLKAELVDETVILKEDTKNNMRNYLEPASDEPVPHYRLFFFDSGKMELVPKTRAYVKYVGVPRSTLVMVQERHAEVMNKLIDSKGSKGPGEMISLPGGCYMMGNDKGTPIEQPAHEVCLSPFKMDKYEVTQRDFQAVMTHNPARFKGADLPVESVTFDEAHDYCKKQGKRLPTEAEWESAARAGTTSLYYWGDEFDPSMGNFCDKDCDLNDHSDVSDGFQHTAPVGSYKPNPAGLYDMAGNVSEWVSDWMENNYYVKSPKDNPKGPERMDEKIMRGGTNTKVFRGGSWDTNPYNMQSAARKSMWIDYRVESLGFRCASN
ncbi:MAG: SUMF1/EgtB/PvdO family nonheme iron enzyme [Candidatus Nitrohelix vancouverensis]|uniref:SUMF1/EgtB/PvdO family nonheme iron enzyme n=1 Tax=Candidatus Nitrohelix vancouverensis TaxID=2705534 RepID=A0A7T0G3F5_9BACT|nr:MAG: SUMF1/EgtB/PvdO family nonheme iron enzyme [Candidatus Nitrohelix vancouverensis]